MGTSTSPILLTSPERAKTLVPLLLSVPTLANHLPPFDMILIDECHHVGGHMYRSILNATQAGEAHGPFLLGLTATPWRPDDTDLYDYFGEHIQDW